MERPEMPRPNLLRTPLALVVLGFLTVTPGAVTPGAARAFTCPERRTVLFPGLTGTVLQDSLRARYRPPTTWNYSTARDTMYARIDNDGGQVRCIYTGFSVAVSPTSTQPRTDAFNAGINAEHTWPQSKGADRLPAEADLHHLFPSEINANAVRGNFPFSEIPDDQTDQWFRQKTVANAAPDPAIRDEYSEYDRAFPGTNYTGRWEPREIMKGDVARAQFYFYTVYRAEATAADPNFFAAEKESLREWAHVDSVSDAEYERTCAIAPHEGDRVNPFVIDPTLVDRAYFPETPVTLAYFNAVPGRGVVRVAWETTSAVDHAGFHLYRVEAEVETRLNDHLLTGGPRFEFFDLTGRPGTDYAYLLEAVGRDGSIERHGARVARFPDGAPAPPPLTPEMNPIRAGATLRLVGATLLPTEAALFDLGGRLVVRFTEPARLLSGWPLETASRAPLAPGLYFLRVAFGMDVRTLRIVVTD